MKNNQVEEKIKEIIASRMKDKTKAENIAYDTPLLSLGIDSILALSILVEIEEVFDIEIDDEFLNMDKIKDIASFTQLVKSCMQDG